MDRIASNGKRRAMARTGERRAFLQSASLMAAGLTLFNLPSGAARADEPEDCAPPPPAGGPTPFKPDSDLPVRTRKNAANLAVAEADKLKAAYAELRKLYTTDPNDPRGWLQQANVHCWYCGGGQNMAAGEEIHGSWWFFPWHRCYLYFHERILGKLIGDKTFALPYWDWADAASRTLPKWYTNPNNPTNSLFDANRQAAPADKLPNQYVGSAVMKRVMGQPTADLFMGTSAFLPRPAGGRLENGPHGAVHLWVGNPGTLDPTPDMGVLATAAQDPVCFAHHANIDRLWDVWLNDPDASPPHTNPTDSRWLNHRWTFYDEEKRWTSISVQDVLDHEANLRYRYEGAEHMAEKKTELTREPLSRNVTVPPEPLSVYVLHIEGIEVPPYKAAVVRVFIDLPTATAMTPVEDSHYVGYFTILAKTSKPRQQHKAHHPTNVTLDIPAELAKTLKGKAGVDVTLVPVAGISDTPQSVRMSFERIRLTVAK
jgi:polyphenol oxidase